MMEKSVFLKLVIHWFFSNYENSKERPKDALELTPASAYLVTTTNNKVLSKKPVKKSGRKGPTQC